MPRRDGPARQVWAGLASPSVPGGAAAPRAAPVEDQSRIREARMRDASGMASQWRGR